MGVLLSISKWLVVSARTRRSTDASSVPTVGLGDTPIASPYAGRSVPWTVAGPTCDSVDVVMRDQPLPEDLQADDFAYIPNAGAYTTAYASTFNGFPLPEVRILQR